MAEAKTQALFALHNLAHHLTPTASGSTVCSYTTDLGPAAPILTLIHGYPQSAYIWRHVVPALLKHNKCSLFIPELPGYGISTPCTSHSKKAVGGALLDALEQVFQVGKGQRRKVILGGHDRGARVCHRLVVDRADFGPDLDVVGAVMLDIAPTKVQWEAFADPKLAVGYFHWPFLANVQLAVPMILAYGGGRWARGSFERISGGEVSLQRFKADGAWELYAELFDRKEAIEGSCEDYKSGSVDEVAEQTEDQKQGKKIEVPTLVMFSKANLGRGLDVEGIWKDWIKPGVQYDGIAVGDGHGHYLPEEACDWVSEAIIQFVDKVS